MTNDLQQARIEAAAEYLYDWQTGSVGYFHTSNHKELWIRGARQALAAADAHLPSVEQIAEEIAGHPIGSGFYQTTVGVGEAREMAEAVRAVFGEVVSDGT